MTSKGVFYMSSKDHKKPYQTKVFSLLSDKVFLSMI
ncbi:hypothetical protein STAB901_02130 [Streptococcus pyogenes STAB901]|nr:hypothetical protein STAB901_02130 [Streptococcus pyogenes STAB901]